MDLVFTQMLCSRLCHDLITPVGAVTNGFEILEDCDPKDRDQVMQIICRSAETVSRRLMFYRAAFGYAAVNQFTSLSHIKQLLDHFLSPLKIEFLWDNVSHASLDQRIRSQGLALSQWGRLLINLILMVVDVAPYGGRLSLLAGSEEKDIGFCLRLVGDLVLLKPEMKAILEQGEKAVAPTPHTIHALYTHQLSREMDFSIKVQQDHKESIDFIANTNRHYELFPASLL